jgi:photosystem II stability/assembly factor-like uncharacterized protein
MKQLLSLCIVVALFFSCSKKSNSTYVLPPAPLDTLLTGWTKVGDISADETIADIFFTDNNNGYAVTNLGIYKSQNAGVSWIKVNSDSGFVNIAAQGSNACFLNNTNKIYSTQNGGTSVQKTAYTNAGSTTQYAFTDAFFTPSGVCYAVSNNHLWKSVNGGASFDTLYNFQNPGPPSASLFFSSDNDGWLSKNSKLLKTNNAGISWTEVKSFAYGYTPLFFSTKQTGFYCDYNTMSKTSDGGTTWQLLNVPSGGLAIKDIYFITASDGYFCTGNAIYKTTDGGISWANVVHLISGAPLLELHFTDLNHGWACGYGGYILQFKL